MVSAFEYHFYQTSFHAQSFLMLSKEVKTIWECTAIKESRIVKVLRDAGYNVITTHIKDGQDFFKYEPENYDMIITNPPYSLKDKFLKRAYDLKKPFMFLLPLVCMVKSFLPLHRVCIIRQTHLFY